MNTKWMRKSLLAWVVLWTGTPLAQAFYNPNSGRWLSRDPIEENDQPNLSLFLGNAPYLRIDRLGLATITIGGPCSEMTVKRIDVPNPKPKPESGDPNAEVMGETKPAVWNFKSSLVVCCDNPNTSRTIRVDQCDANVEWWAEPIKEHENHEQDHVGHWKGAWSDFGSDVTQYIGRCYPTEEIAACYKGVLQAKYQLRRVEYKVAATTYDYVRYGIAINEEYYRKKMEKAIEVANTVRTLVSQQEQICAAMKPKR